MSEKSLFDVEKGFISKLLETKDIATVKDCQITIQFLSGENKIAFQYIQDTYLKTGDIPTVRAFESRFPRYKLETYRNGDFEVVGTEENLKFWCAELRKKLKHNKLADGIDEAVSSLQEFKTEEAYTSLKSTISYIEGEVVESTAVDITKDTADRKEAYLRRKENRGMMGVPFGIKHLDYLTKGMMKGTVTTLVAKPGVGKALTLDTPVLTVDGFVPMREIKVGSKVFDELGGECNVTAVYPQGKKQVYRVTFEDDTYVDCCKDHLWKFKTIDDIQRSNSWRVETTEQLIKRGLYRGKKKKIAVPVSFPIDFKEKRLPLPPYVLGCLLACSVPANDGKIYFKAEQDILYRINSLLEDWGEFVNTTNKNYHYIFKSGSPKCNKLYQVIDELGLKSIDKHIPAIYMRSGKQQRLQLVQGIIDTNGSVVKNRCRITTGSKQFKDDVVQLLRSLGIRCFCSEHTHPNKENVEYAIRLHSNYDNLFLSDKHTSSYDYSLKDTRNYDLLYIKDIECLDHYEEMQCITVDSILHTFICGDYIVTHNTWLEVFVGSYCMLNNYRVLQFVTEMTEDIMRDRYEAMLFGMCYGEFSYNRFKSGTLSLETEKRYFEFLDNDLPRLEPLILERADGVMSVAALIDKHKPDIVLIDGMYLMSDDQNAREDWARLTHISRDLKTLANRTNIPFLVNTQLDQKAKGKNTGLGDIKYAQAIAQDSDTVMELFRDELMINDREMGIKLLKQREGVLGKVVFQWDFDKMNFSDIYYESEATDDYTDEGETSNSNEPVGVLDNALED